MHESWIQRYILLALRLDKGTRAKYEAPFVEAYYGPQEWRRLVESEPEITAVELVREAQLLLDELAEQGWPGNRECYLSKHVLAMETLARKLCGEHFALVDEIRNCLDIELAWTDEVYFAQAHALYEAIVPGTGELGERVRNYQASLAFPPEQRELLREVIEQALVEARRRTQALVALPADESLEVRYLDTWEHDAAAYYLGDYRTQIVINVEATGKYVARLFDHKICHETYPGHHTEYVLKEQHLYREQGYLEQAICLTLCPQCVIQEGIAMTAHTLLFAEGEAERWIVEHVYRALGREVDPAVLVSLRQASEMLGSVEDNAALWLDAGRPDAEVAAYLVRYRLLTPERATAWVASLKHPLWGRYIPAYAGGQRLVARCLAGAQRRDVFRRLLTEQVTPGQLAEEAWKARK